MLLTSQILLIIAGVLLIADAALMFAHRPNPIVAGWPLPCPATWTILGLGLILFSIANF